MNMYVTGYVMLLCMLSACVRVCLCGQRGIRNTRNSFKSVASLCVCVCSFSLNPRARARSLSLSLFFVGPLSVGVCVIHSVHRTLHVYYYIAHNRTKQAEWLASWQLKRASRNVREREWNGATTGISTHSLTLCTTREWVRDREPINT